MDVHSVGPRILRSSIAALLVVVILVGIHFAFPQVVSAETPDGGMGESDSSFVEDMVSLVGVICIALIITAPVSIPLLICLALFLIWAMTREDPWRRTTRVDEPPWPPVR